MADQGIVQEIFGELKETYTGEVIFDHLSDIVYFVKDAQGRYAVVNKTLAVRYGVRDKKDLIGRTPSQLIRSPLGQSFEVQDQQVLRTRQPIVAKLELHAYPSRKVGWCLTSKTPLINRRGRITGIVGISQDLRVPNMSMKEYQHIAAVAAYAEAQIAEAPTVRQLAEVAQMSLYQLDRRMQIVYGLTTGQWVLRLRLDYAERQLRETDLPVGTVALNVGYQDQAAFTRQFRRATGMSPTDYRKSRTSLDSETS